MVLDFGDDAVKAFHLGHELRMIKVAPMQIEKLWKTPFPSTKPAPRRYCQMVSCGVSVTPSSRR